MDVIFITGVSTGIGYDAFKTLCQSGYHVIGTVRKTEDASRLTEKFGTQCTILVFDVTDIVKMQFELEKVKSILEEHGLKCLINSAGLAVPGPLQYLTEDEFELQLDVNVKAVRRITNAMIPFLKINHSKNITPNKIINISSVSGLFNSPFNGAYCISKHALESMNDVYRRELADFGIQVIAIEPGPIKTEIWRKNFGGLDRFKDTEYGKILGSANKIISNAEKSALDVSVITQFITKIINSKNPKTRYIVHQNRLMFKILAYWLPDKWVDKLVKKTMKNKESFRPI